MFTKNAETFLREYLKDETSTIVWPEESKNNCTRRRKRVQLFLIYSLTGTPQAISTRLCS